MNKQTKIIKTIYKHCVINAVATAAATIQTHDQEQEQRQEPEPEQEQIQPNQYIIRQLQSVLMQSSINHKTEIMKEPDIKFAHIYCKINKLSGQVSGPLIEYYIKEKYGMTKNCASLCIGDLQHHETALEIKISLGGKECNKFNFVQIRMNHICEYLLTAYYLDQSNVEMLGELFIFKLNKTDIKQVILQYGGYAHGTIKKLGIITQADLDSASDKEYAFRPKYGDECWKMLLPYRVAEICI